jgi:hypothetical protein
MLCGLVQFDYAQSSRYRNKVFLQCAYADYDSGV